MRQSCGGGSNDDVYGCDDEVGITQRLDRRQLVVERFDKIGIAQSSKINERFRVEVLRCGGDDAGVPTNVEINALRISCDIRRRSRSQARAKINGADGAQVQPIEHILQIPNHSVTKITRTKRKAA